MSLAAKLHPPACRSTSPTGTFSLPPLGTVKQLVISAGQATSPKSWSNHLNDVRRDPEFSPQRYTRGRWRPRYTRLNHFESFFSASDSAEARYPKSCSVLAFHTVESFCRQRELVRRTHRKGIELLVYGGQGDKITWRQLWEDAVQQDLSGKILQGCMRWFLLCCLCRRVWCRHGDVDGGMNE